MARSLTGIVLAGAFALMAWQPALAQDFGRSPDDWCGDRGNSRRASHCEVREMTIADGSSLDIDASRNGGIAVRGWDRSDALVRARIVGYGSTDAEAQQTASEVRIETSGGRIRADGPSGTERRRWAVSFEVQVPRAAALMLNTRNGGISLQNFQGSAEIQARNGGVTLRDVGGDIRGGTRNGGITVDLSGDRWQGKGLDVATRNGGIRLAIPASYSAELETGTTNGRVRVDFPVTVQGTIGRRLQTTLGSGGATVRAITTNGGVSVTRK